MKNFSFNQLLLACAAMILLAVVGLGVLFGASGAESIGPGMLLALMFIGQVQTVDTITETSTPDEHQVRDVSQKLTEKYPDRFPIDTILRRLNKSERAEAEKVEWEEDDVIPRESQTGGSVAGGGTTATIPIADDKEEIYRVDDQIFLPDSGQDILLVTAVNAGEIEVRAIGGDDVPALDAGDRIIRTGNAKVEGFDASKSRTTMPEQRHNLVQAFDATIDITGRRKATKNYTRDDWDRSRDRQMYDFRNNMENTLIAGKRSKQEVNGENLTTMGGVLEYITVNMMSYDASTFDERDLLSWCRQLRVGNAGSQTRYLFADPYLVEDIAGISLDKVRRTQVESKTLEIMVDEVRTEFLNLRIILHLGLHELGYERFGIVLDMENVERAPLRPMKAVKLRLEEQGTDKDALQLKEESTLRVRYDKTHGIINGTA